MDINFSKLFKRFHNTSHKEVSIIERDWKFIVLVFLALNSLVILCSLYLFWISNSAGNDSQDTMTKKAVVFKQKNLDTIVSNFAARKDIFTNLQTEKPTSIDPSL